MSETKQRGLPSNRIRNYEHPHFCYSITREVLDWNPLAERNRTPLSLFFSCFSSISSVLFTVLNYKLFKSFSTRAILYFALNGSPSLGACSSLLRSKSCVYLNTLCFVRDCCHRYFAHQILIARRGGIGQPHCL